MKPVQKRILITLVVGAVLLAGFFVITNQITKHTGYFISEDNGNQFEKCLSDKDITYYMNSVNPAETIQNIELFEYVNRFDVVNCYGGNNICLSKGVNSFPTWIVENNAINEDIGLSELVQHSGCRMLS